MIHMSTNRSFMPQLVPIALNYMVQTSWHWTLIQKIVGFIG